MPSINKSLCELLIKIWSHNIEILILFIRLVEIFELFFGTTADPNPALSSNIVDPYNDLLDL